MVLERLEVNNDTLLSDVHSAFTVIHFNFKHRTIWFQTRRRLFLQIISHKFIQAKINSTRTILLFFI